jgi:hypothetical protein
MNKILNRIYKVGFIIFAVESILLLIGIRFNLITYGIETATPITEMIVFFVLIILSGLRFSWSYYSEKFKVIFAVIYTALMLILGLSYLIDDGLEFTHF